MKKQSFIFHVHGMHCKSCVILTETELQNHKKVEQVMADLDTCCVRVEGYFDNKSKEEVAAELSKIMEPHGYKISTEKEIKTSKRSQFKIAIPIALTFLLIFFMLQRSGIVDVTSDGEIGYPTIFLLGIVASISTCMAVVGALVLSVSANFAKEDKNIRPQITFHIGRLISFFVLGGVIGLIGSVFQINPLGNFILTALIAVVMLILGINLLDVFPWAKRLQPTLPKSISDNLLKVKKLNNTLTPFLLGAVTFLLPCGFTQSMQIYTLSTESFWIGGLTMFIFALGTLPVLAMLSFGSLSIKDETKSEIFFKTIGIIVIFFAIFNIFNSVKAAAAIAGGSQKQDETTESKEIPETTGEEQIIAVTARNGYTPSKSTAKANTPTILRVQAKGTYDCSAALMIPAIGYKEILSPNSTTDIQIPPQKPGTVLQGLCSMGMYRFTIQFK